MALDLELLPDFLTEAGELLDKVEVQLIELERNPSPNLLNEIFRGFHTIKGGASFLGADNLVQTCHAIENIFDLLRKESIRLNKNIMDIIMDGMQDVRRMFEELAIQREPGPSEPSLIHHLHYIIQHGDVDPSFLKVKTEAPSPTTSISVEHEVEHVSHDTNKTIPWNDYFNAVVPESVQQHPTTTVVEVSAPTMTPETPVQATTPSASVAPTANNAPSAEKETTIRVETGRLDQVLTMSGEIGLTKNRLNNFLMQLRHISSLLPADFMPQYESTMEQLNLQVTDLQNAVMKTRMQPIGRLFQRYPRVVRDLSRTLEKDVVLHLEGEETEIDKTMIEELSDPLIHLIRNAVDHGIENASGRVEKGKNKTGNVWLGASQQGDSVFVTIRDDGAGMDPDVLRQKVVEKGLLTPQEANNLSDQEAYNLIFMAGFSTKEVATDVSGRGVGMDVVRTNIQRLNGTINIDSKKGHGTVFIIKIPLTLAILPILVIYDGDQPFAVPLNNVQEIIPIQAENHHTVGGRQVLSVRDEVLPYRSISHILGREHESTLRSYGMILHHGSNTTVIGLNRFGTREDIVVKPLEQMKPPGISGATLLGDGSVVMVIDIDAI